LNHTGLDSALDGVRTDEFLQPVRIIAPRALAITTNGTSYVPFYTVCATAKDNILDKEELFFDSFKVDAMGHNVPNSVLDGTLYDSMSVLGLVSGKYSLYPDPKYMILWVINFH
tara:strand:+ start:3357 stop:3698 length:342 start_codon:yes stop_codon:yes gene_type:complete